MPGNVSLRDRVGGTATTAAMIYDDSFTVAGTTIRVDSDTAKAILKSLNVRETSTGEYIASLRDRPLESRGTVAPSEPARQSGRAIADRTDARTLCDICGNVDPVRQLAVDHDHRTGALRGFLCGRCNTGLGMFLDHPENLRRAADYLDAPPGVRIARYVAVKTSRARI